MANGGSPMGVSMEARGLIPGTKNMQEAIEDLLLCGQEPVVIAHHLQVPLSLVDAIEQELFAKEDQEKQYEMRSKEDE